MLLTCNSHITKLFECHISTDRCLFVHLFTLFIINTYLGHETNVYGTSMAKKTLEFKLDIPTNMGHVTCDMGFLIW